jgi:hypothetical protein
MLERVRETLHAAALDPEARAQVSGGCLERELRHVGLGAAPPAPTRSTTPRKPNKRIELERSERLKAARKAAADARRAAERASRDLLAAEERRDRAVAALDDAERDLAKAREAASDAARVREQSERALSELSG